jgi:hypothetical protein
MSKKTIKGGIYYDTDRNAEGKYTFFRGSFGNFGSYIEVCEHTIEFDLPDAFDPRPVEIEALKKKASELNAEFNAKVTEINRRISELQAITYEAEEA